MMIFVQLQILVDMMKGIAMIMMSAKMVIYVALKIVYLILGLILILTAVKKVKKEFVIKDFNA